MSLRLAPGDRVLVTGAAGFIGSALTRLLLDRDLTVTALVEPGHPAPGLAGLAARTVAGDIRDRASVEAAVAGNRVVFHAAALYRFWSPEPERFYQVNVEGSRNVVAAAVAAGCERIVYTSTIATLGLRGRPADETSYADVSQLFGWYKRSKYVAEHEVLRAAAEGAPVVLVQPTHPVGPRDYAPTPSGRLVLDFLNGRMPGYVDTAMNIAHVEDVAAGHLLAAEHGRTGRSYILGGENLTMAEVLGLLASACGLAAPRRRVPAGLALAAAAGSQLLEGRLLRRDPHVPWEGARMARTRMVFDDSRARDELGYTSRPAAQALRAAARWYLDEGLVSARRRERITLADSG